MNSKRAARVLCLLLSGATAMGRGKEPPGPRAIAPNGREFVLEIAKTREKRAHGYMERSRVGPGEGMLFIFPDSDFHTFWMKNCLVSLDILWLGDDLSVVHLEHDVPACRRDPCPSYPSMSKARYVLELRAGMAKKSRLRIGEKIRLKGIDLDKVEVER